MTSLTSAWLPNPIATPTTPAPASSGADVDADMGQDDQRGHDDDHAQYRGAKQRQQRANPGPARQIAFVDRVQVALDRGGDGLPDRDCNDEHDADRQQASGEPPAEHRTRARQRPRYPRPGATVRAATR
mgnify:CR=1 FL=1